MAITDKTYGEVLQEASSSFSIEKIVLERLMCERLNWNKTDFVLNYNNIMLEKYYYQFQKDLNRLLNHEPLQYIIGYEWFFGRKFFVDVHTLIPRPETELLVEEILKHQSNLKSILDIGTGTGAIAISLKLEQPNFEVTASDISHEALCVAQKNANQMNADIRFIQSDLFENITEKFDCIVSNPPYIAYNEKYLMDKSVLEYEPHLALFAENNGLSIYEKLAEKSHRYLNDNGMIILEIGFNQGESVKNIFTHYFPNKNIEVLKDYANLDRIVLIK